MPRYIVKIPGEFFGYYMEWSTIVDAPTTFGMTRSDFEEYYRARYGTEGMEHLPNRMERADKWGASHMSGQSAESLIAGNHAGPNESELTMDEIYRAYCLRLPIRDGWTMDEHGWKQSEAIED